MSGAATPMATSAAHQLGLCALTLAVLKLAVLKQRPRSARRQSRQTRWRCAPRCEQHACAHVQAAVAHSAQMDTDMHRSCPVYATTAGPCPHDHAPPMQRRTRNGCVEGCCCNVRKQTALCGQLVRKCASCNGLDRVHDRCGKPVRLTGVRANAAIICTHVGDW